VTSRRDTFPHFDARFAQTLPLDLEISAGLDNLFDARPALWAGAVRRQLYVELTYTFNRATIQ
jgi:outer membrane receptor protein involved in Fe transport